jgi:DNA polymerase-3 subunit delta
MIYSVGSYDEKSVASAIGVNPYFVKDYLQTAKIYHPQDIEKILLLLHEYNLKSIGVDDAGTEDAELLKEMVVKMIA